MLASSWKTRGLVEKAWLRLSPPTRKELARLTGIAEPNLSGMNTGRLPTTLESAERICAKVPGLTLADLGAREAEVAESDPTVLDRLEELAVTLGDSIERQKKLEAKVARLQARVRKLEALPGAAAAAPRGPR
jgi:hypothetical protein